jgi:signal transduction histidine kinase/CheY-like chemotaxis protein
LDEAKLAVLRQQVLGLGERSFRKSWYPELQARLEELELFRSLLDCTSEAIIVVRVAPPQIADFNTTALTVLGVSAEELRTLPISKFVPAGVLAVIESGTETKNATPLLERWPTVPTGRELEAFIHFSGDAPRTHAVLTVRDVTERRALERQALTSQRLEVVGRLVGGIAHDFNNLLGAIIGTVELVRANCAADSDIDRDLSDVTFAANRAALLTRRLMTFGRTGSGKPTLVNVNTVVNELMRLLARIVGERASVFVESDPESIWVMADPIAIEQVVVNLVSNARDAVSTGGTICIRIRKTVECEDERPCCLIEVEDDGAGMDSETQRRVFEPFFTTKDVGRGTGLGLSVVANVVKECGGRIELESEPGKGTRVRVHFPCHVPPAASALSPRAELPSAMGEGRTVLVVEDERSLRKVIARTLQKRGFEVFVAEDVDEAAFRARRLRRAPNLLISDMVLPDGTGSEVAKLIEQKWGAVPTLFISGYIGGEATNDTELQVRNLLSKPFSPEALLEWVARLL